MTIPSQLLGTLIALLLALAGGYWWGSSASKTQCTASKVAAQEIAIERHDTAAVVGQTVERETVRRAVKTEAVFNGLTRRVITYAQTHPVATDCHLDADGLRLWVAANDNAALDPTSERDAGMPGAAAADERPDDRSAGQPPRGGPGIPPVPGQALGADSVDRRDRQSPAR